MFKRRTGGDSHLAAESKAEIAEFPLTYALHIK